MLVKRFVGQSSRDALRQVKAELGEDAAVILTRALETGQVEVLAVAEVNSHQLRSILPPNAANLNRAYQPSNSSALISQPLLTNQQKPQRELNAELLNSQLLEDVQAVTKQANLTLMQGSEYDEPKITKLSPAITNVSPGELKAKQVFKKEEAEFEQSQNKRVINQSIIQNQQSPASENFLNAEMIAMTHAEVSKLSQEVERNNEITNSKIEILNQDIRNMKSMLQGQMASLAWAQFEEAKPTQAELFKALISVGISPLLCRQVVMRLPKNVSGDNAIKWAKSALAHNIIAGDEDKITTNGGIYAFVGPTGVGKTTTIAKLAARSSVRYGGSRVLMISTDDFRVGGYNQLRNFAKMLSVEFREIQNETDLNLVLSEFADKSDVILIDSIGMSQRDSRLNAHTSMFSKAVLSDGRKIEQILVLACNTEGQTLEDVAKRYNVCNLSGCILSKMDEAVSIGNVIDTVIRHKLAVYYVTNGQRIPGDIHVPNPQFLVSRAFKSPDDHGPYALREEEHQIFQASHASRLD